MVLLLLSLLIEGETEEKEKVVEVWAMFQQRMKTDEGGRAGRKGERSSLREGG